MTVIATASNPRFTVSRVDIDRAGPTYTIDTLRDLAAERPGTELYFITGADALAQILGWKDSDELFDLAHFVGRHPPRAPARRLGPAAGPRQPDGGARHGDLVDRLPGPRRRRPAGLVPRSGRRRAVHRQASPVPAGGGGAGVSDDAAKTTTPELRPVGERRRAMRAERDGEPARARLEDPPPPTRSCAPTPGSTRLAAAVPVPPPPACPRLPDAEWRGAASVVGYGRGMVERDVPGTSSLTRRLDAEGGVAALDVGPPEPDAEPAPSRTSRSAKPRSGRLRAVPAGGGVPAAEGPGWLQTEVEVPDASRFRCWPSSITGRRPWPVAQSQSRRRATSPPGAGAAEWSAFTPVDTARAAAVRRLPAAAVERAARWYPRPAAETRRDSAPEPELDQPVPDPAAQNEPEPAAVPGRTWSPAVLEPVRTGARGGGRARGGARPRRGGREADRLGAERDEPRAGFEVEREPAEPRRRRDGCT